MKSLLLLCLISLSLSSNLRFLQEHKHLLLSESFNFLIERINSNWINLLKNYERNHEKTIKEIFGNKTLTSYIKNINTYAIVGLRLNYYDRFWKKKMGHLEVPEEYISRYTNITEEIYYSNNNLWKYLDIIFPSKNVHFKSNGLFAVKQEKYDKYDMFICDVNLNNLKLKNPIKHFYSRYYEISNEKEEFKLNELYHYTPNITYPKEIESLFEFNQMLCYIKMYDTIGIAFPKPTEPEKPEEEEEQLMEEEEEIKNKDKDDEDKKMDWNNIWGF